MLPSAEIYNSSLTQILGSEQAVCQRRSKRLLAGDRNWTVRTLGSCSSARKCCPLQSRMDVVVVWDECLGWRLQDRAVDGAWGRKKWAHWEVKDNSVRATWATLHVLTGENLQTYIYCISGICVYRYIAVLWVSSFARSSRTYWNQNFRTVPTYRENMNRPELRTT